MKKTLTAITFFYLLFVSSLYAQTDILKQIEGQWTADNDVVFFQGGRLYWLMLEGEARGFGSYKIVGSTVEVTLDRPEDLKDVFSALHAKKWKVEIKGNEMTVSGDVNYKGITSSLSWSYIRPAILEKQLYGKWYSLKNPKIMIEFHRDLSGMWDQFTSDIVQDFGKHGFDYKRVREALSKGELFQMRKFRLLQETQVKEGTWMMSFKRWVAMELNVLGKTGDAKVRYKVDGGKLELNYADGTQEIWARLEEGLMPDQKGPQAVDVPKGDTLSTHITGTWMSDNEVLFFLGNKIYWTYVSWEENLNELGWGIHGDKKPFLVGTYKPISQSSIEANFPKGPKVNAPVHSKLWKIKVTVEEMVIGWREIWVEDGKNRSSDFERTYYRPEKYFKELQGTWHTTRNGRLVLLNMTNEPVPDQVLKENLLSKVSNQEILQLMPKICVPRYYTEKYDDGKEYQFISLMVAGKFAIIKPMHKSFSDLFKMDVQGDKLIFSSGKNTICDTFKKFEYKPVIAKKSFKKPDSQPKVSEGERSVSVTEKDIGPLVRGGDRWGHCPPHPWYQNTMSDYKDIKPSKNGPGEKNLDQWIANYMKAHREFTFEALAPYYRENGYGWNQLKDLFTKRLDMESEVVYGEVFKLSSWVIYKKEMDQGSNYVFYVEVDVFYPEPRGVKSRNYLLSTDRKIVSQVLKREGHCIMERMAMRIMKVGEQWRVINLAVALKVQ